MEESQLWLELNNALRKRLPRPLNLCQFLTLPIGTLPAQRYRRALLRKQRLRGVSWFLETGGGPPKGITMLGRWHAPKNNRGFCLAEREDVKGIYEWTYQSRLAIAAYGCSSRHRRHRQARCPSPLEGTYLSGALRVHSDSARLGRLA
jgi:hypothetical protein